MNRYTIYFKDNKAICAYADVEIRTHELVKISNGELEWLIVHAHDETSAIQLCNSIADDFLKSCLYIN